MISTIYSRYERLIAWSGAVIVFVICFSLYAATLAPGPVPGDPSEYIFVPHILGIAHPPGYAFYTLLAKLWQTVVRVGTVAYRTNLLAACAGALIATLVYGTVLQEIPNAARLQPGKPLSYHQDTKPQRTQSLCSKILRGLGAFVSWWLVPTNSGWQAMVPALFAALSAAAGVDLWQHAIHSNAHILTALLATLELFLLTRWWRTGRDAWLAAAVFVAGLSLTHHPVSAFGFPAYGLFVLWVKPRIVTQPRKLIALAGCLALGLTPWLYYVVRGPNAPFNTLPTLDSLLIHVTARGLTVNLFQFGLRDQPTRLVVLWQLLRLQYPLVTLALAVLCVIWLVSRRSPLLILLGVFFLSNVAFTINTIQDVMAYLIPPFVAVAVMAGIGLAAMLESVRVYLRPTWTALVMLLFLMMPIGAIAHILPRVSLRDYDAGSAWVDAVFDQFAGKGQRAVLLSEWEALTPLWVAEHTQGRALDPADVQPVYIAATSSNPWLEGVFAHWGKGPIYLAGFRREVWEGGLFRLRPEGRWPLWRVAPPGDTSLPQTVMTPLNARVQDQIEFISYTLDNATLRPGESAHLTLAMRALITPTSYLMPFVLLGERQYRWTTDSRSLSPTWQRGEVIVERYDLTIPFGTPPGKYPLRLGLADLSNGQDLKLGDDTTVSLGEITINPARGVTPPVTVLDKSLANFNSEIALMQATGRIGLQTRRAIWTQPLDARPGQDIDLWLDWRALKRTDTSYKVFVHLIQNDQLAAPPADYYTPLGGAFPTALWIPVWLEGQAVADPYRLTLPAELPPGGYAIEIGLYDLMSKRRAPLFDRAGNLAGDRVILGGVSVR